MFLFVLEMDYLNLPSTILFQANDGPGTVTLPVYIPVYDDEINESDEEVFAVILELADAVDPSRVDLSVLNATLCIIADNDGKRWLVGVVTLIFDCSICVSCLNCERLQVPNIIGVHGM